MVKLGMNCKKPCTPRPVLAGKAPTPGVAKRSKHYWVM
jgi:hypothetical protein